MELMVLAEEIIKPEPRPLQLIHRIPPPPPWQQTDETSPNAAAKTPQNQAYKTGPTVGVDTPSGDLGADVPSHDPTARPCNAANFAWREILSRVYPPVQIPAGRQGQGGAGTAFGPRGPGMLTAVVLADGVLREAERENTDLPKKIKRDRYSKPGDQVTRERAKRNDISHGFAARVPPQECTA
ncbi:hypothetical protein AAFF_G00078940 [Aldrovandia affinis]|uniref:Uncharacterized protein n=1 Tax=Aldrovandia affinis TaxID=143900 RepID=A0AAD7RXP8_9TELE|nr:hypothetical protein AAFF_G00078940 [Aldrovandia affinis]